MVLIDSSVWIDYMQGNDTKEVSALWDLISDNADLCTTGIVIGEILIGMKSPAKRKRLQHDMSKLINLPANDPEDFIAASDIYVKCRKEGTTIRGFTDCLIAAIAIKNDVPLFQKDRDFESIKKVVPQLRLFRP